MERSRYGGAKPEDVAPPDRLEVLAELAAQLGADRVRDEALALAERVGEGRFYVACIGQFKRGKSTLLNALVGRPILPTGVVPVTATPTVLRYGDPPSALVRHARGETRAIEVDAVAQYVAEDENPGNAKEVTAVEVLVPSPLLRAGMCLVDTPGLGSVYEVATESTHAFVPHIDAALLVVGADPPISAEELALAARVAEQVEHLIVVLTKADRVDAAEREQAVRFTERMLRERIGRSPGPVLEVSAAERLDGDASRDWDRLLVALRELSEHSGRSLVRAARERAVRRLGGQLRGMAAEQRRLLTSPVEELERRLGCLRTSGSLLEERLLYLGSVFTAEQELLAETLLRRRQRFLGESVPAALEELDHALDRDVRGYGPGFRRKAAEWARGIAERRVEPWLVQEEGAADEMYREVSGRLVATANELLDELAASGEAGIAELPHAAAPNVGLRRERRFYFNRFETYFVSPVPWQWLFDLLAPPGWFRRRMRRKAREFLRWLFEANATRVRSDLLERVAESRRGLEAEIRSILREARGWTERAIERAEAIRASGAEAVEPELAWLDAVDRRLAELTAAGEPEV